MALGMSPTHSPVQMVLVWEPGILRQCQGEAGKQGVVLEWVEGLDGILKSI